ncbi:MAG: hypothetical protein MRJ65_05795 [Candidatus Brocadiaceae bacterium]|nr:hypothetical protein [Candidatus Brocadiaceae bacterium]
MTVSDMTKERSIRILNGRVEWWLREYNRQAGLPFQASRYTGGCHQEVGKKEVFWLIHLKGV